MIVTDKTYIYHSFGLKISSELPLPELETLSKPYSQIDVSIKMSDLKEKWNLMDASLNKGFCIVENKVMFEVPDLAVFSIEEGRTIYFSPSALLDENKIRLYLLGSCMGILLMQRQILPLHGSAIAINGKAYVFIGESGAGKSTIASSFMKNGHPLLSDDVIAVSLLDGEKPWVIPAYPQQKLWQDSMNHFGMNPTEYKPLFDRETKYSVPVVEHFYNKPLLLGGIFELVPSEVEQIEVEHILNLKRFQTLSAHTYRRSLIEKMNMIEWHFHYSAKCIRHVPLYQLRRPSSTFITQNLVNTVLHVIKEVKKND